MSIIPCLKKSFHKGLNASQCYQNKHLSSLLWIFIIRNILAWFSTKPTGHKQHTKFHLDWEICKNMSAEALAFLHNCDLQWNVKLKVKVIHTDQNVVLWCLSSYQVWEKLVRYISKWKPTWKLFVCFLTYTLPVSQVRLNNHFLHWDFVSQPQLELVCSAMVVPGPCGWPGNTKFLTMV